MGFSELYFLFAVFLLREATVGSWCLELQPGDQVHIVLLLQERGSLHHWGEQHGLFPWLARPFSEGIFSISSNLREDFINVKLKKWCYCDLLKPVTHMTSLKLGTPSRCRSPCWVTKAGVSSTMPPRCPCRVEEGPLHPGLVLAWADVAVIPPRVTRTWTAVFTSFWDLSRQPSQFFLTRMKGPDFLL